ncbi:MAG: pyridoxamine 5'-phosphate oxidase family protein [Propionibacteriaceae bacterium]|jgi:hypothetical protein|nr:pyridoxamine 5'-phosphate oxidase family protein [Propionibacteriaceae bacterium]
MDSTGHFAALETDECRHLLRGESIGRIVWLSPTSGLQSLPVAYRMLGHDIFFRTDPESILGELSESTPVAFQIDDVDVDTQSGWSVLVQGTARRWDGSPPEILPTPWVPGIRPLVIRVEPATYSGRAVAVP